MTTTTPTAATILVVEDEPGVRRLIKHILRKHGFNVLDASNATKGLILVQEHHPHIGLVIVDMVMPGMSGLDLAAELGRAYPDVSVLYISGYTDSIVLTVLQKNAPNAVLPKPFTESALLQSVRQLLHTC